MRSFIAGVVLVGIVAVALPDTASAQARPGPGRRPPAVGQRVSPPAPQDPRAGVPGRPARLVLRRLRRLDANHDRQISRDEFKGPAERFGRLDRNSDGVINRQDGPRPGRIRRPSR